MMLPPPKAVSASPRVVDQLSIDARALSVGQDLRRHVQRIGVGIAVVGDVVRDDDRRKRPRLLQRDALLLGHRRLDRDVARHGILRPRNAAEVLLHHARRLIGIEIAHDGERRVGRHVVSAEERAHVLDRGRLEILHAADDRVLVGVNGERLVVNQLGQPAVRLVLDLHPALFLDDQALALKRVFVDAQASPSGRLRATASAADTAPAPFPSRP